MSDFAKTGWIKYEYWTKGSHSKDNYLFIGVDADQMAKEDVFEYILDHEGNWARFAERFRAEWEANVVPPKEIVEKELKTIELQIEALNEHRERLNKYL